MTTASQTPGALPPETPPARSPLPLSEALTATPANTDVPHHLRSPFPEPLMPQCCMCGTGPGNSLVPDPRGRRYESGAQVLYCRPCAPPPLSVQAAETVIAAAMKRGAVTPRELAQAEADTGILFDAQAAADIAAAAAEQAHADDEAELAERGRQLARMAGDHRKLSAVLRLLEGRPGTDLLTVAEIAAAAEYGTTAYDAFPMTLGWTGDVAIPGPTYSNRRAVIKCMSSYGGRADLVVSGRARIKLASLLDAEARDSTPCPTDGCGTADDHDASNPFLAGWARLEFGAMEGGPRWYCSPMCVSAAFARAGEQLAADDQAAAVDPDQQAAAVDPLAYGPTGIPCGCGKPAHSNLVPCQPDEPADEATGLDARYGQGASDEHALQVAEATEAGFVDERGDVDDRGAEGGF